jgi:alpha-1,3-glucosyltransferase
VSENNFLFFKIKICFFRCLKTASKDITGHLLHSLLLLCNVGLIIVDHIHFQYNGILFGILLLSCGKMFQRKFIQSAFYFAVLLNMKHIFIYMAPVYFCYLLRVYCFGSIKSFIANTIKLGSVVIGVTAISFGPFVEHLPQVISRLFPFKRGLTHAYWAPNFWALYNFADKVLSIVKKIPQTDSNTGGLVQEFKHNFLPSISPAVTFAAVALWMIPCCIKLIFFKSDSPKSFMKPLIICAATSFMFGWHVHEKAILMILIPLQVLTFHDKSEAGSSLFVAIFGLYSLLPLLFTSELVLVKLSLYFGYIAFNLFAYEKIYNFKLLHIHEQLYCFGIIILPIYEHLIQYVLKFDVKYPFLPLMITSVYCGIGMTYFWMKFYCQYLFQKTEHVKKEKVK